jgi:hypothetical protein
MRRLLLMASVSAALLVLSFIPGRAASSAKIEWVDPSPPPPEASAPLPPRESRPPAASEAEPQTLPAEKPPAATEALGSSRPPPAKPPPRSLSAPAAVRVPMPQPRARPTAPGISPLTAEAANFINAYWANVGGPGDQVLPYLASIYAPIVNYYGKPATRESILQEKYNFIRRWPMRQTWVPPGASSPSISCDNATAECEITGVRDFDAVSPERGARSIGAVRYTYTVRFTAGAPQIVGEESRIVSRE